MASAAPSRPFLFLDDRAMYHECDGWGMVECECRSKVAYGCGPLGQQIAEGLTVLADVCGGDDDEDGFPRLDLSDGAAERRWERQLELSIWALEGFVEAGLPRRVPCSPFIREQDAGVIYLFLPPANVNSERGCHLIGIDVRDSSEPRLLPPRRLAIVPWMFNQQPMLLAPDFFDRRHNHEEALSQHST